eukprot:CAMPEP_0205948644 /NCGR_PEP_ID=MMETSP1459-20131121/922_1 /ASSEMBLY_ACC=CAM_ASM_001120 /TAXON_ID=41880 /ORGANISM="Pycnococcus provasolii, Strain RCC931" /LENGTH=146 /DNA_ID=CAMNT_0053319989 /DNA_START=245 /DNA_END=686 /DNA_ORIENTATION=+
MFTPTNKQTITNSEIPQAWKVVLMLQGRYAGKKAVIVKNYDDGTSGRAYGHALVVGLSKYPRRVKRKDSKEKQAKDKRLKCFVKMTNYNHLMPTRYTLDVDLKGVVTPDVLDNATKKVEAQKKAKKLLEERFESGKNRWFYQRLPF